MKWMIGFLLLSGCLVDYNNDNHVMVACVGDSNTELGYLVSEVGWCELLNLPTGVVVRNYGQRGAGFNQNLFGTSYSSCQTQVAQAINEGADLIVAACGTNNLDNVSAGNWGVLATNAVINPALTAGRAIYLLGIPPIVSGGILDLGSTINQKIAVANTELATVAGTHWIASPGLVPANYDIGGVHLVTSGQQLRAIAVAEIIKKQ